MLHHYFIQNIKDGILIRAYNVIKESVANFSQFISVKVKKVLKTSQTQFRKKLRKLRIRQNDGFLKRNVYCKRMNVTLFTNDLNHSFR